MNDSLSKIVFVSHELLTLRLYIFYPDKPLYPTSVRKRTYWIQTYEVLYPIMKGSLTNILLMVVSMAALLSVCEAKSGGRGSGRDAKYKLDEQTIAMKELNSELRFLNGSSVKNSHGKIFSVGPSEYNL